MFGATTNYPFNFSNRLGIPLIESTNITVNTDNVVIGIPKRAFRFLNGNGVILFRLNTAIPETASTLPILFASNEFTQALTLVGGEAATATQLNGAGVYFVYYDKNANILQLMSFAPTTTTATQNTTETDNNN
ncbi:hypothetical protein [Ruminococcus sp.]|uniref:hypothetical protein n=1 Tax=Ruminococcus sp. TaxID=41978 RepID=UPI002E8228D5|nr:hypothetical protein [Ruminococcus sp.]MEE3440518.1 hypothetical protein [Ruminococcus sp.]